MGRDLPATLAYSPRIDQHKPTLQLNINNLLDKDYYANASGRIYTGIPGSPLSVLGSLKDVF